MMSKYLGSYINSMVHHTEPITPYKGANSLSPFVTLADR